MLRTNIYSFLVLSFLVTAILYLPSLRGPIFFDDKPALTENRLVQISGDVLDDWRIAAKSSNAGPLGRPLAMLSFAVNHAVAGGFVPWQLKLVNLMIHLATGVALYLLFICLLSSRAISPWLQQRKTLIAGLATAVWLLHPLHVSTVLYTVQRMAQLSALFVVLGLLVFSRARLQWADRGAQVGDILATALWLVLLTLLAVWGKENGALLPWLILVLEVAVFKGVWRGGRQRSLHILSWVLLLAPVVLIGFATWQGDFIHRGYANREFSLEERLLTQSRMMWHYLHWLFLPDITAMGFHHDDIPWSESWLKPITTILSVAALLAISVIAVLIREKFPVLLFALLFFLVGHSMESSVLALEMVYEHRNYLPSIGVCLLVAALAVAVGQQLPGLSLRYLVGGLMAVLALLLFVRANNWGDEARLMKSEVINHPDSARANFFYASDLLEQFKAREELQLTGEEAGKRLVAARHHFERMYQQNPDDLAALVLLYNLDSAYFPELGERVQWLPILEEVVARKPLQASDFAALYSLVDCYIQGVCGGGDARLLAILDRVSERYPRRIEMLLLKYKFLKAREAPPGELLSVLDKLIEIEPGALEAYYHAAAEAERLGETGRLYGYFLSLVRQDDERLQLSRLRKVFAGEVVQ